MVVETKDQDRSIWNYAAIQISNPSNHSVDGRKFKDWRLPTKDELYEIYLKREAIGGFAPEGYWSSTTYNPLTAWYQVFIKYDRPARKGGPPGALPNTQDWDNLDKIFRLRSIRNF